MVAFREPVKTVTRLTRGCGTALFSWMLYLVRWRHACSIRMDTRSKEHVTRVSGELMSVKKACLRRERGMKKHLSALALMIALVVIVSGCDVTISTNGSKSSATVPPSSSSPSTAQFGTQSKTANCQAHGGLPDS